jgi:hypothetical protein
MLKSAFLSNLTFWALITASKAAYIQWPVASGGNGNWYGLTTSPMSWNEAESFAAAFGGHLVSITSADEQAFVETTFLSGGNAQFVAWIGINDGATEGSFTWSSGEAVAFTNWTPAEPNDSLGEDYGVINWHHAYDPTLFSLGKWNDAQSGAGQSYFGIIELPAHPNSAPEPTACCALTGCFFLSTVFGRRRKLKTDTNPKD